jgi:hypothetical protein
MMTAELTVLEKLFQEDHPMGGSGTGICLIAGGSLFANPPLVAMEGGRAARLWPNSRSHPK